MTLEKGKRSRSGQVKPWRHFASTLRSSSASLGCSKDGPFHVTRRRDSSCFIDDEFDLKECFIINASIMT